MSHPPTIFLDIDGTILKTTERLGDVNIVDQELLPGVLDKLQQWESAGCRIILTTGRRESQRRRTEGYLTKLGVCYDQLIMGLGGGIRVLINDKKSDGSDGAYAINVERNGGLENCELWI